MTNRRYNRYRRTLRLIDAFEGSLGPGTSDVLRDAAQDLLLTRGEEPEDIEEWRDASTALRQMVDDGDLDQGIGTELWVAIRSCGPESAERELAPFGLVRDFVPR